MKIIPTWPKASLPRFNQTAFLGRRGQCNPEEPFGET